MLVGLLVLVSGYRSGIARRSFGVESEDGKGSKFWFEINVGACDLENDRRTIERPKSEQLIRDEPEPAGQILLVEDNPINRIVVERLLQKGGYKVINAEDGQQAIEVFKREAGKLDLVLMDMQMPVMGGLEATQRIRAYEAHELGGRIPVIALTANAFEKDRESCIAAGMDDFLTKPISANHLIMKVERWLARHHGSLEEMPFRYSR